MFDFEKCLKENGFVADFENTDDIAKLMNVDENENPDWYDNYFDELSDFAHEHRLEKFCYKIDGYTDIFYSKDPHSIVSYIIKNYYTADGNKLSEDDVLERLTKSN